MFVVDLFKSDRQSSPRVDRNRFLFLPFLSIIHLVSQCPVFSRLRFHRWTEVFVKEWHEQFLNGYGSQRLAKSDRENRFHISAFL